MVRTSGTVSAPIRVDIMNRKPSQGEVIMGKVETFTRQSNIMVVDDEATVCRSVEKILSRRGYQVAQALCVSDA